MRSPSSGSRPHGRTNDRSREILEALISGYPAGKTFVVAKITSLINTGDTRRNYSNHRTSRLLQERSDVRQIATGIWEVVR